MESPPASVYVGNRPLTNPMDLPTYEFAPSGGNGTSVNFTQTQAVILEMSSRLAATVSIICSLSIIATFLFWKKFRTPANRLLAFMAFADFISACSTLLGKLTTSMPNYSPLCIIQAFLMQWGDLSSVFWTAAMSFNLFMVLFMTRSARDLVSLEKFYFFVCFGVPFLIAFTPIFIWNAEKGLAYGHDVLWCWISPAWDTLRIALFYVPVWTVFVFNLTIYIISSIQIIQRTADLPPLDEDTIKGGSSRWGRHSSMSSGNGRASAATIDSTTDGDSTLVNSNTNGMRRPPALSCASTLSTSSHLSLTTLKTFRTRYFVRIGLFLLAYLLVWMIPTINRFRGWAMGHEYEYRRIDFIWYWMQEILVPLRGCINFLCYFILAVVNAVEDSRKAEMKY